MESTAESSVHPECRIEIVPLPPGDVEIDDYRVVYRGNMDIRCTYPYSQSTILPRRSTVSAVYVMHIPEGYELRRISSPPPIRYSSTRRMPARRDFPSPPPPIERRRVISSQRAPRAIARRSVVGPTQGFTYCQCFWCRQQTGDRSDTYVPAERRIPEYDPGSSSRPRNVRIRDDVIGTSGPGKRIRLSVRPDPPTTDIYRAGGDIDRELREEEEDPEEDPDGAEEHAD